MGEDSMKKALLAGATYASVFFAASVWAANVAPDSVMINDDDEVANSLTGTAGDAVEGRDVYANRKKGNCLACHQTTDLKKQLFHGEVGPPMDGVAKRYEAPALRAILVNSKTVFGDETIMPGFYSTQLGVRIADKFAGKTILSAQEVEDVIAYLQTLK
jgi:sulfur-oxidizing protein SoxX